MNNGRPPQRPTIIKDPPDPDYHIASHASPAEISEILAGLKAARATKLRNWPKDAAAKARLTNRALSAAGKCIEAGNIPSPGMRAALPNGSFSSLLDAIVERMRSTHQSALAAMPPAPHSPIDDAAWRRELERRRYLEERIPLDALA